jgi:hypothetical protein
MRYLYGLEYYKHTGNTMHKKLDENLYETWLLVLAYN